MIPSDSIIRTPEGLLPLKLVTEHPVLWTGSKWANATIWPLNETEVVDIYFDDGSTFSISPDTKIYLAGPENYLWKRAGELSKIDRVCISLPDGKRLFANNPKMLSYWTGYMFSAGRRRDEKIEFDLKSNSAEFGKVIDEFKVMFNRRGYQTTASCYGPRFQRFLDDLGAWFDDKGRMAHVPPGCRLMPGKARRLFVRGALDGAGNTLTPDRSWHIDLETENRAIELQQMFKSVGIMCELKGVILHIKKWLASYELKTPTMYPSKNELIEGEGIPYEIIDEFMGLIEEKKRKEDTRGGIFRLLASFLKENPNVTIHPTAMRAAWRQMKVTPPVPIFGTIKPVNVLHRHKKVPARRIEIHDTDHCIDINSCVIGDTMR